MGTTVRRKQDVSPADSKAQMDKADTGKNSDRMRSERDRFLAFAFSACDFLIEIDSTASITWASGSLTGLRGVEEPDDLIGRPVMEIVKKDDRPWMGTVLRQIREKGRINPVGLNMVSRKKKGLSAVMGGFCMPEDPDRIYLSFILSERLWAQEGQRLPRDARTGLMDRSTFEAKAEERVLSANADEGDLNMGMVLVKGLRQMAESGDPEKIDQFLKKLGALLRSWSLGGDTAGSLDEGKYSVIGDEALDAEKLGEIKQLAKQELGKDAENLEIQVMSMELDTSELEEADAAKALAYSIGRFAGTDSADISITSLTEGARAYLDDTVTRVQDLREVIDFKLFQVAFQPIVDLKSREAHHYEALSRFEGAHSPFELISFAEKVGMIQDLDLVIAQKVLDILKDRASHGWKPMVAINISARSLQSELFVKSFRRLMAANPDHRRQLIVEITESAAIDNLERFDKVIQVLRRDGHEVSLDDVGAGQTSFESLRAVEVDHAKIDGDLVRLSRENKRERTLLESIIKTCIALDYEIIAERVETEDEARQFHSMGVQFGQGYLFGRPSTGGKGLAYKSANSRLGRRQGAVMTWG